MHSTFQSLIRSGLAMELGAGRLSSAEMLKPQAGSCKRTEQSCLVNIGFGRKVFGTECFSVLRLNWGGSWRIVALRAGTGMAGGRDRFDSKKRACTEHRLRPRVKRFASTARLKPYLDRAVHVPHLAPPTKIAATCIAGLSNR